MSRPAKPFYFADDEDSIDIPSGTRRLPAELPFANGISNGTAAASAGLSRVPSHASETQNLDDILLFPVENSHAYSYAHLSPNSLALRLNVLKRSLEILNERPDWLRFLKSGDDPATSDDETSAPSSPFVTTHFNALNPRKSIVLRPLTQRQHLRVDAEHISGAADRFKLSSNASSAALSALFRPSLARSDSFPRSCVPSARTSIVDSGRKDFLDLDPPSDAEDSNFSDDLKDIIELIEQDASLLSTKSDIAATLHDLSLSSAAADVKRKQSVLKTKLLFALATPFVESANASVPLWGNPGRPSLTHSSTTALNLLSLQKQQQPPSLGLHIGGPHAGNRPFHALSAGKHSSPQSIVTVEADFPWGFKAVNDLACLMFGVLKSMIKNVTLVDLIAPQFRNFVTERMTKVISNLDRHLALTKTIIFAGEIVAITRHSEGDFAWTSIWAQKKGNLIIFMFEQISCDAFDILVLCSRDSYARSPYTVTSVDEIAGNLLSKTGSKSGLKRERNEFDTSNLYQLLQISETLDADLKLLAAGNHPEKALHDWEDSGFLNRRRYYTLQLKKGENIPCALTSYPIEKDDSKFELKLKVHSMPYIAGMFVVDFQDLKVLSCNKAIARNLFGAPYDEILDHSIDKIIPGFSKILHAGLDDQGSALQIVPGLVLPEHFFRKYDAVLRLRVMDTKISPEHAFLHSCGIEGLHRDGKPIYIDVQLRVVHPDIFVLWVTYSRHSHKNIHKHIRTLGRKPGVSEIPLPLRQNGSSSRVDLPSQLKLFPEDESDILELGSSSSEVSRHSSTRRPKRASTFAVPVTCISDTTLKLGQMGPSRYGSLGSVSVSVSESASNSSEPPKESTRPSSVESENSQDPQIYKNFTEEDILAIENRELEDRKTRSKFWPLTIGERKRTKKYSEFRVLKKIGEGAYGKVVLAEHNADPAYRIIIKCIDKQRILVDTWVRDRKFGTIPSEIQVIVMLNHEPHPNILRIVDYFEDPDYYYLETPVFGDPPAIDLFDYIEVKNDMSELNCQLIFKQVVLAIYHLHKHGIVHRDIKDENIIVNEVGIVKLIDFGSAGYVKLGPFDVFVGTVDYASPEVLRGEKYDGKPQDIWALGILLYIMLYKENPFHNVDDIMEGEMRVPYVVSDSLLDLIEKLLVRGIDERPTITDVAEHDWLNV